MAPAVEHSTLDFLKVLFEGLEGFIEFRIIGKGKTEQVFVPVEEALTKYYEIVEPKLKRMNMGPILKCNIYFGANPRTDKVGDNDHVVTCRNVWVDLDYKDKEYIEKNYSVLKALQLEPNIIVDSGHGYHLWWNLKEEVAPADAAVVMKTLARVLAGDPKVTDAPRIMRLPGFFNVKENPLPSRVLRWELEKKWNLSSFDPLESVVNGLVPPALAYKQKKESAAAPGETPKDERSFYNLIARAVAPFWKPTMRHAMALGVAGLLRKDGISKTDAITIVKKITVATGDDEIEDRLRAVEDTYEKAQDSVAGASALIELLGPVADDFLKSYAAALRANPGDAIERAVAPEFDLYTCIPSGEMIEKYVWYAASETDSPLQYHVASIISVCAAALGNRVSLKYHGKPLFPTLYTMLCAPSSRFRKSTAVGLAAQVAYDAKIEEYPENATPEQLYARMAPFESEWKVDGERRTPVAWRGEPSGVMFHAEFTQFLESSVKGYMADARSLMMHLYDGTRTKRETKSNGRYYIDRPAVSMLCGVTPTAIKNFCTKTDVGSGFLARFLIVMPPREHHNKFGIGKSNPEMDELRKLVVERVRLLGVYSAPEPIALSPEAEEVLIKFEEWISERIKGIENTSKALLDPFYNRLSTMAYKISLVYAAIRCIPVGAVSREDAEGATSFCRWIAKNLDTFYDDVKSHEGNREAGYVEQTLKAARGLAKKLGKGVPITHRLLIAATNLNRNQFQATIETLVETGHISEGPRGGRGGRTYVLNEVEKVQ